VFIHATIVALGPPWAVHVGPWHNTISSLDSTYNTLEEKAPLSFAFDLIAWSLDFDLVDLSAETPLDLDTFSETSWIQS
jgi:hypothetical protein